MNVQELIAKLQKYEPSLPVLIPDQEVLDLLDEVQEVCFLETSFSPEIEKDETAEGFAVVLHRGDFSP